MYSRTAVSTIAILVAQPLSVLCHMLLAQPPPIGQINNSPLDGPNASGGGGYPCKYNGSPSFYSNSVRTNIPLGSNYTVKFTGSAVHGGGSCQFSLSKDLAPTESSSFKVIYSIQGGCPARNTPGNLGNDAGMANPFEYPFTMPADLEPGQYTFAWTWINKVGNREFYMNCAAVDVTGTEQHQGKTGYYDSLPDMAVVNVKGVDCVSEPDNGLGSFKYQNPGQFVETNEALQTVEKQCFAPISGRSADQSDPPVIEENAPTTTTNEPAQASTYNAVLETTTATTVVTAARDSNQQAGTAGVFVTRSSNSSTSAPTGFSTIFANPTPASAPPPAVASNDVITCPSTWQSCAGSGFFCIDTTHFGLCSFGCMPQAQELAAGVGCNMETNTLYDLRYPK